mgnify:CR=1 FL=1
MGREGERKEEREEIFKEGGRCRCYSRAVEGEVAGKKEREKKKKRR